MWQGKAYAVVNWETTVEISLSRVCAQEILMDYALEAGYWAFITCLNCYGDSFEAAMEAAEDEIYRFSIWEYNLV